MGRLTWPLSQVFSMWPIVSAAVEHGSMPAHSTVIMECVLPATEMGRTCNEKEQRKRKVKPVGRKKKVITGAQ